MRFLIKFFPAFIITSFILAASGCQTFTSPQYANAAFPADGKYEILGRITISSYESHSGYLNLLSKAKELYPETDDVVNIIVDGKESYFFTYLYLAQYTMSGIAIKYDSDRI